MSDHARRSVPPSGGDEDGVRVTERGAGGRSTTFLYQGVALFLVACSAGYVLTPRGGTAEPPAEATRPRPSPTDKVIAESLDGTARAGAAPAGEASRRGTITTASGRSLTAHRSDGSSVRPPRPAAPASKEPQPEEDTSPDLSDFVPPGETPTAAEVIEELHKRGIYDGIGAFPPPGTSPPLVGLAVPEDFELPEGYVRHYQATDDGRRIEPILMFSPDYDFFDENGQPIAIPENRVVPPELAPPGLPIRQIHIPKERRPGDVSR